MSAEDLELSQSLFHSEALSQAVEKKLLYMNDPAIHGETQTVPKSAWASREVVDLVELHQHIGLARFGHLQPWKTARSLKANTAVTDIEGFSEFQRDVEIQLEDIANLLEKFQEKLTLLEEFRKQTAQTQIVSDSVKETSAEFSTSRAEFEALINTAVRAKEELTTLVGTARDVLRLENTVGKLETDLAKAQNVIEELESRDIALNEQHYQATQQFAHKLKSSENDLQDLTTRLSHLREAYDALVADHKSLQDSSGRENDSLRRDLDRYKRLYKETAEELQTKEEVHSALKANLEQLAVQCDRLTSELAEAKRQEQDFTSRTDRTIDNLESEIARMKAAWTDDIQLLNQTRYEREQLAAKLSAYEKKVAALSTDNERMRTRIEELKVEARANLEASRHPVTPDKSVKSATGTVARIELDYQRELQDLTHKHESEIDKLNEEIAWLQGKLKEEKESNRSLGAANARLLQQLEDLRKKPT